MPKTFALTPLELSNGCFAPIASIHKRYALNANELDSKIDLHNECLNRIKRCMTLLNDLQVYVERNVQKNAFPKDALRNFKALLEEDKSVNTANSDLFMILSLLKRHFFINAYEITQTALLTEIDYLDAVFSRVLHEAMVTKQPIITAPLLNAAEGDIARANQLSYFCRELTGNFAYDQKALPTWWDFSIIQKERGVIPYFVTIENIDSDELWEYYWCKFSQLPGQNKVMVIKETESNRYHISFISIKNEEGYDYLVLNQEEFNQLNLPCFPNDTSSLIPSLIYQPFNIALSNMIIVKGGNTHYVEEYAIISSDMKPALEKNQAKSNNADFNLFGVKIEKDYIHCAHLTMMLKAMVMRSLALEHSMSNVHTIKPLNSLR